MTQTACQLLNNHNLSQLVLEPTHRSGHIIDWLVARESDNLVSSVSVTDQLESDHKAVLACLKLSNPDHKAVLACLNLSNPDHKAVLACLNLSKPLRKSRIVVRRKR